MQSALHFNSILKKSLTLLALTTTFGLSYAPMAYAHSADDDEAKPNYLTQSFDNVPDKYLPLIAQAEQHAKETNNINALNVLKRARNMTLSQRAIIKGGCWNYLDTVFRQAGVNRQVVHQGKYQQGPYAKADDIQAGDWLYYINHSYHDIEHSGMFIGWVDKATNQALILSYAGEHRHEPARYRVYDISHVYQITRPK